MTRLIFRFKRTLVTPTFPASSFTDVSTVPTRRHLSRELTEPSPPATFPPSSRDPFQRCIFVARLPLNRGRHTLRFTHALRSVPFRSVSSRGSKHQKIRQRISRLCGYRASLWNVAATRRLCLWPAELTVSRGGVFRRKPPFPFSCSTSYTGTSTCVHKRDRTTATCSSVQLRARSSWLTSSFEEFQPSRGWYPCKA